MKNVSTVEVLSQFPLPLPESDHAIICEEMASGGDVLPWADRIAYAERMLKRDVHSYNPAKALSGSLIYVRLYTT